MFGSQVQQVKNNWIQSDLRFVKMRGQADLKSMEKGVNWIVNQRENLYKMLKIC